MSKKYEISERRLKSLLRSEAKLEILESDGVDNWCNYMYGSTDYVENAGYDSDEYEYDDVAEMQVKNFKEVI